MTKLTDNQIDKVLPFYKNVFNTLFAFFVSVFIASYIGLFCVKFIDHVPKGLSQTVQDLTGSFVICLLSLLFHNHKCYFWAVNLVPIYAIYLHYKIIIA